MDLKELKTDATKKLKEIEKSKKALDAFLLKVEEIRTAPKDKKEKLTEKLEAWLGKAGIAEILS